MKKIATIGLSFALFLGVTTPTFAATEAELRSQINLLQQQVLLLQSLLDKVAVAEEEQKIHNEIEEKEEERNKELIRQRKANEIDSVEFRIRSDYPNLPEKKVQQYVQKEQQRQPVYMTPNTQRYSVSP